MMLWFRERRGTIDYGIFLGKQHGDPSVVGCVDADYIGDLEGKRYITGHAFTLVKRFIC